MKNHIVFIASFFALVTQAALGVEPTAKEMEALSKSSYKRDSSYEMKAVMAFWGDRTFFQKCVPANAPTPAPFTIYLEVLPSGVEGRILFVPLTETAKCIKEHTAGRAYPKPHSAYVSKINMSFK